MFVYNIIYKKPWHNDKYFGIFYVVKDVAYIHNDWKRIIPSSKQLEHYMGVSLETYKFPLKAVRLLSL